MADILEAAKQRTAATDAAAKQAKAKAIEAAAAADAADAERPSWTIGVSTAGTCLTKDAPAGKSVGCFAILFGCLSKKNDGKPKRQYSHTLVLKGVPVHTIVGRFSDLNERFSGVTHGSSFPALNVFSDYTNNETNVTKRAESLRQFYESAVNKEILYYGNEMCSVLGDERFLRALGTLSSEAQEKFASVVQWRADNRFKPNIARNLQEKAEEAAEKAREAAIAQQRIEDCDYAQVFNSMGEASNCQVGSFPKLAYPREMVFDLQSKWWSGWGVCGSASIMDPVQNEWFLLRTTHTMWDQLRSKCQYELCTMSGEPLLLLQESWHLLSYEYNLYRVDPQAPEGVIHICKIVHDFGSNIFAILENYTIDLTEPQQLVGGVKQLVCSGGFPSSFSIHTEGRIVASFSKHLLALRDRYELKIEPNADILLFIGIACGIARIQHEIHEKRRRR
eukprot:TRINITY_DN49057_c0_g1_i1.p1 TRINITY_DN49057_c0_g1~~TRINITY_DN49057_c0_g1_i1.p1  ORF type:complete len:449 (+),score=61.95 TRINITY_DN49057_c0_g1_i1:87-1433(+)